MHHWINDQAWARIVSHCVVHWYSIVFAMAYVLCKLVGAGAGGHIQAVELIDPAGVRDVLRCGAGQLRIRLEVGEH